MKEPKMKFQMKQPKQGIWGESLQNYLVALAGHSSTSSSRTFTDDCKEIV